MLMDSTDIEILHGHLFCGLGGGAKGFNAAKPRLGMQRARFRCAGGIDNDASAIRDFTRAAGVAGTVLDMFDRDQYIAFHGAQPPADWREATPADIHAAFHHERPHIVFLSAPCKGFSGLLAEGKSKTDKYQALNRLTLRGIWLLLEAYKDDPVELLLFENVPRIATRGRHLLDQIGDLLRAYGYAVAETTHDCGELAGLAQSRKRFLLVARHIGKVAPFLYEPAKKSLRAVGDVLDRMLLPGDMRAGPMHRVPSLQWKTWVRLAFVEAGSDWRSLDRLDIEDGVLRDYLIVPEMHGGTLGVREWQAPAGVVAGASRPGNGSFSVADPRQALYSSGYGVNHWEDTSGAVAGESLPSNGRFAVADPRHTGPAKHSNEFRIVQWSKAANAVTSAHGSGQAVADPRPEMHRVAGDAYLTGGHYGVLQWNGASGAVSASACHDNGRWSIADPRPMPAQADKMVCRIQALDGTWHRPFTTLELAALQSLVDPEEQLELDGLSDQAWRERIGNAVPPAAATAIAEEMGRTLMLAWSGETFALGSTPIWVRDVAVAISVAGGHA